MNTTNKMRGAKGPARPGHRSYPAATKHAFNHIHGLLIDAKAAAALV
jgi:hypothetical protein